MQDNYLGSSLLSLRQALREKGYRHQADHKGNPQTQVAWHQVYSNGETTLIVQIYRDGDGFQVFAPLCATDNLTDTLAAIPG